MTDTLSDFKKQHYAGQPDDCPECNGTGLKLWGKLGVRKCVKCKGTGKKVRK